MNIITLDLETYYDQDYSLSKMTTEAYVRDPRFEVILVGVKVDADPTVWFSGTLDETRRFLAQYDWCNAAVLCHNTVFDGAILSWHFGIKPKLWLDTMSMARPLHNVEVGGSLKMLAVHYRLGEKGDEVVNAKGMRRVDFSPIALERYASYCVNDVDLTYELFKAMKGSIPVQELLVIDQTIRMFTEPVVELDVGLLQTHLQAERKRKEEHLIKIATQVAGAAEPPSLEKAKAVLMSNAKFAEALTLLGANVPYKVSPTTGKTTYAFAKTDKGFLALTEHEDEDIALLAQARLGVKSTIEESRTERLLEVASRGNLPVMLAYYAAHTGRFGGADKMNLQNLPRGGTLRKSLKAPKGKVFVACDSSQIEARVVAYVAGQNDLIQAFREKRDVYSEFASDVYQRKVDRKKNPNDVGPGFVGKTCILGLGYGMGGVKFRRTLEIGNGYKPMFITQDEAERIVKLYRGKYFKIEQLWRECNRTLGYMEQGKNGTFTALNLRFDGNRIYLPNGLFIQYPVLQAATDPTTFNRVYRYIAEQRTYRSFIQKRMLGEDVEGLKWTYIYGGKVAENITQALARIVVTEQMIAISKRFPVKLQVHDELVCCVDESEADECKAFMEQVMSTPPVWAPDLPVACEAGVGESYGESK